MKIKAVFCIVVILLACGCGQRNAEHEMPKPRGYFRLRLPEKAYIQKDTIYPFIFEIPVYSSILPKNPDAHSEHWFNIEIPSLRASIHFSYKVIQKDLYQYTEDTRNFVYKHVPKAENIKVVDYSDTSRRVFGLIYYIYGADAASPMQFYVTDSVKHFLRGAMYFNHTPNNDSIQPIIDFVTQDIWHFIETLRWKK